MLLLQWVCPAALRHEALPEVRASMMRFSSATPEIAGRIAALARISVSEVPPTEEIVDDVYTRLCHGEPLPCFDAEHAAKNGNGNGGAASASPSAEAQVSAGTADIRQMEGEAFDDGEESAEDSVESALGGMPEAAAPGAACLSIADAEAIVARGDEHYAARYDSASVRWLMYPFLSQVQ
jgi:hypothetical protein